MSTLWDLENQLSSAQAFTTVAVTTNSYAKQSAAQDLSIGCMMSLLFIVTTAAGAGTSVLFEAVQADDAALTTNVEALGTATVLAASLTVGARVEVPFPKGTMTRLYLGGRVTCTGGTATVSVDCYLIPTDDIAKYKSFPKVVNSEA